MTSGNPLSETLPWLSCCWCINYPFWHPGRKSSYVYTTIYGYRSKLGTPINASKKTLPVIHVDTISRLKSVVPPGLFAPYPMTCPRYDLGGGHMNTRAPVLFLRNCWPAHHFHQNRGPCLFFSAYQSKSDEYQQSLLVFCCQNSFMVNLPTKTMNDIHPIGQVASCTLSR